MLRNPKHRFFLNPTVRFVTVCVRLPFFLFQPPFNRITIKRPSTAKRSRKMHVVYIKMVVFRAFAHLATRAPLRAGHVTQSCRRQHQRRFAIGKRSHRTRSSPYFSQQSLQRVVRPQSPSASPPLLSRCSSAPPSTRCDKNAPRTAGLPDKTPRGFPPIPNTCRKQTAARLSVRALSGATEMPSSSLCLPSTLPLLPALRRPSSASTTSHPETHTGAGLRSDGFVRSRSARRSSGSARSPCSG